MWALEEAIKLIYLQCLQSLTLILPRQCEIIVFTTANNPGSGRFAFSLDIVSEQFREELKLRWSNVTWRVILGHNHQPQTQLWNSRILPDWQLWQRAKFNLAMDDPQVGHIWEKRFSRFIGHQGPLPLLAWKSVDNGDGRTLGYLAMIVFFYWVHAGR